MVHLYAQQCSGILRMFMCSISLTQPRKPSKLLLLDVKYERMCQNPFVKNWNQNLEGSNWCL